MVIRNSFHVCVQTPLNLLCLPTLCHSQTWDRASACTLPDSDLEPGSAGSSSCSAAVALGRLVHSAVTAGCADGRLQQQGPGVGMGTGG